MRSQDRPRLELIRCAVLALAVLAAPALTGAAFAADYLATLRNGPIDDEATPPPLKDPTNNDLRQGRNYPEQPPLIPHKVRDYQVDLNVNKCLDCHSRAATERSQAPMVSITHFVDREGQVRAFVTPRRYFCDQCHVPQQEVQPLTGNTFVDVDSLITKFSQGGN